MFATITTYLNQRTIAAVALCTALAAWYLAAATILPAALQYSALPETDAVIPEETKAQAGAICTGMACSIDAKNGQGCCCVPEASDTSEDSDHPVAYTITKDCDDLGVLTLSVSRSIWQVPHRLASPLIAPQTNSAPIADENNALLPSHPKDIKHIPILLAV